MLEESDQQSMMAAATWLAMIQDPLVQDQTGFSNADVSYGRRLVQYLDRDPADEQAARALAYLVAVKYRRQSAGHVDGEALSRIAEYGQDKTVAREQRERMRSTVFVQRLEDGRFSVDVQSASTFADERIGTGVFRDKRTPEAVRYVGDAAAIRDYVSAIERSNGVIVGDGPTEGEAIEARAKAKELRRVQVLLRDNAPSGHVALAFERYDGNLVETLKSAVPSFGRRFDKATASWLVEERYLPPLTAALDKAGAGVTALRERFWDWYEEGYSNGPDGKIDNAKPVLRFEYIDKRVFVGPLPFELSAGMAQAAKALPQRSFDGQTKRWHFPVDYLPDFVDNLDKNPELPFDYDEIRVHAEDRRSAIYQDEEINLDPTLMARLRPYQVEGVAFMTRPLKELRTLRGPTVRGVVNGDEMGLGKTVQTIVSSNAIAKPDEHIVVVAPANAVLVWRNEIRKFLGPDERINVIGEGKGVDPNQRWHMLTYNTLPKHYDALRAMGYGILVVDEAQYCKNHKAIRSVYINGGKIKPRPGTEISVEGLAAGATRRVFALTGTPFPNRLKDSFAMWRMVGDPVAASFHRFAEQYCEAEYNGHGWDYNGAANVEELRDLVSPVFTQRFYADVAKDVPLLTRRVLPIDVDRGVINRVRNEHAARIIANGRMNGQDALAYGNALKFATAHAKVPHTIEHLDDLLESGRKVIVFSEYTSVLDLIQERFKDVALRIDGSLSSSKKQERADRFQSDSGIRLMIGQVVSAGTAITLTKADWEVFNDLSWNPDTVLQAERRAARIGVEHPVTADYMAAAGTLDEKLANFLEDKISVMNRFEGRSQSIFRQLLPEIERDLKMPVSGPIAEDLGVEREEPPSFRLAATS